jgi:hypothetical protein
LGKKQITSNNTKEKEKPWKLVRLDSLRIRKKTTTTIFFFITKNLGESAFQGVKISPPSAIDIFAKQEKQGDNNLGGAEIIVTKQR